MPFVTLPLSHSEATITRYVANSVIEELRAINPYEVQDVIWVSGGRPLNPSNSHDGRPLQLEAGDYILVDYTDGPDLEAANALSPRRQNPEIFHDAKLGVRVTPTHQQTRLEMTIRLRSTDRDKLIKWLAGFNRTRTLRGGTNYHQVQYLYVVPDPIIAYIRDIHYLSEQVHPYGITLAEYLKKHAGGKLSRQTMLNGKSDKIAVNIHASGVMGQYGEIPPAPERNTDAAYSEIEFTYTVRYEKPVSLTLEWQPTIHNQRVPKDYIKFFHRPNPVQLPPGLPDTTTAKLIDIPFPKENAPVIFVDPVDPWQVPRVREDYQPLMYVPIQLDLTDPFDVLDLKSLVAHGLPQYVLDLLALVPTLADDPYQGAFLVELFAVDHEVTQPGLVINDQLEVRIAPKCHVFPRQRHYLQIAALEDLSRLNDRYLERLRYNPTLCLQLIQLFIPTMTLSGDRGHLKVVGDPPHVTMDSWSKVLKTIPTTSEYYIRYYMQFFSLVMSLNITVRRS